jgi:hypothetical protein
MKRLALLLLFSLPATAVATTPEEVAAFARLQEKAQHCASESRQDMRARFEKLVDQRQFVAAFDLVEGDFMCTSKVGLSNSSHDIEKDLMGKSHQWAESAGPDVAMLVTEAHATGRDEQCLRIIDGFSGIWDAGGFKSFLPNVSKSPKSAKPDKNIEKDSELIGRMALYCYPACVGHGGPNCEKAKKLLDEMSSGAPYEKHPTDCKPEAFADEKKLIDGFKEDKKYWELFKLVTQGSMCHDAFELMGIRVEWQRPIEHAMATFVSAAHAAGKDEECLHIIDTYPRAHLDFGKNDSRALRRSKNADEAMIEYTRTCYAGCAKRGGIFCESVKKILEGVKSDAVVR